MENQAPVAHTHTLVITYNKTEKTTQIHVYTLIQAHDIECIMFYILMMFIQSDYQKHIQHYVKYRIVFAVCFSNQARLHLKMCSQVSDPSNATATHLNWQCFQVPFPVALLLSNSWQTSSRHPLTNGTSFWQIATAKGGALGTNVQELITSSLRS